MILTGDILTKKCTKCGRILPATEEYFHKKQYGLYGLNGFCKICAAVREKEYLRTHKDERRLLMQRYRGNNREYLIQYMKEWNANNKSKVRNENQERKLSILSHYGGSCSVCGESNPAFLTIDHVNNDGAEHRKQGFSGWHLYSWIVKNEFPPGFQVLCWNHNWLKHLENIRPNRDQSPQNLRNIRSHEKVKRLVIDHYGECCCKCNETNIDLLTIDHINGGGRQQLREIGCNRGAEFYRWLRDNGFPLGFQVLCWNHNCGKDLIGA